ncbi:MAG: hypothetical protein IKV85_02820 [Ruminococcus sp.]|nr:hypothetical protein [Ruminococcus sp.]
MNKYKQNLYTILLIFTCFIASPFIFHKIWKESAEAKKQVELPPPTVSSSANTGTNISNGGDSVSNENSGNNNTTENQPQENIPPADAAPVFGQSDISYFNDALFIGDSRTVGIQEYGIFTNSRFFCSIGMSSSNIDNEVIDGASFDDLIKNNKFGKVYVMLGVNEVGNDFQYTLTKYRAIIERLKTHQPDAIIYIQANLHVSAASETNIINNANINYLNSLFAELADNKKVFYIDINELYDDENGCLTAAYTSDGVHPLAAYYKQWCEWLCQKTVATDTSTEQATTTAPATPETPVQ